MRCSVLILFAWIGCVVSTEKEVVLLPPERVAEILPVAMQCVGETGVSAEIIFQYKDGKQISNDKKIHKFIHCVFVKTGYSDENGRIKIHKAMELFPKKVSKDKLKRAMELCNKKDGEDKYETAYNVANCFRDESPVRLTF